MKRGFAIAAAILLLIIYMKGNHFSNLYISIDTPARQRAEVIELTRPLYHEPCQPSRRTISSVIFRGFGGRRKIFSNSHPESTGAINLVPPPGSRREAPSFGV